MKRLLTGSSVKNRTTLKSFKDGDIPTTPPDATPAAKRARSETTVPTDLPQPMEPSTTSTSIPDKQVLDRIHRPQGSSAFMSGFKKYFWKLLKSMLSFEAPTSIGDSCPCATAGAQRLYHCNDCFDFTSCCATCFIKRHESNPFHWAEFWNGSFLERQDLSKLGFILPLKHGPDCDSCPRASPILFTVIDVTGIHETKVAFCRCLEQKHDRVDLLLRCQIFPATLDQPQLGFTFNVLRDFHLQTLTSKKSSYDYLTALRRRTSNGILSGVSAPYSQFLRVQRLWRALTMIKRSGQVHQIDKELPLRREGNLSVPCFACPEPGFNVPDEQWGTVDEELKFLNTLMLMMDGHFGLQRLAKGNRDDPDDVSLLEGHALFPPDNRYNDYVRNTVAYSEEKSTCSKFNAVDMQNKLKFKGSVITGVIGVACNRHMVFLSLVDLQKGERYANADFGLAYALERFLSHPSVKNGQYYPEILVTYDVACQYCVHLKSRFSSNFIHLSEAAASIRSLVPKKHLDGHKEDCKYRFSLNYSKGTGRGHGEGIEVTWSESKQSGGSTRQMNHGHRHDTLNDFHNDWNWTKLQGLAESLGKRLKVAVTTRMKVIDHFLGLSLINGEVNVREWEKESTEPRLEKGEWCSVYRFKGSKLPSQASILQSLERAEKNMAASAEAKDNSTKQPAVSRVMYTGIKLQDRQCELKHQANSLDVDVAASRRSALAIDLKSWRKSQVIVLPQLHDTIVNAPISAEPENECLFLPSDIPSNQHQSLGLDTAAKHEFCLREGQANDSIKALCNNVIHGMVLRDEKRERVRGVYQNTRATKQINGVTEKKATYISRYRFARTQILKLDPSVTDDYPELKDEHAFAKNAASSRKLGDGKSVDSWIWTFGKLKGLNDEEKADFVRDTEKVQWFRAQADMERWVEEVDLLEEDFRRLIRGCRKMDDVWTSLSRSNVSPRYVDPSLPANIAMNPSPGYRAYAHQKAAMFRKMAVNADSKLKESGGGWPSEGETLSQYVWRKRPQTSIDWEAMHAEPENDREGI